MPEMRPLAKGRQSDEHIQGMLQALSGGEVLLVTFVAEVLGEGLETRRRPLRVACSVAEVRRLLEGVVPRYEDETEFSAVNGTKWSAFMRLAVERLP